ncbi:hypothetical protein KIH31_09480 [Paenarthrobacter sp. DKR-5]|uniref:hypothetical protein n=1 Tax=Paenarthrobacter sp. DKR-5 TaxID=2835535 RepID=UPI001BDD016F|nr:hypothetical protein [Paenarthrobacter sp. DKR-5]MBT1002836.1 hypothetical protein [Paenarthrobacter sp. DKR-5]
MEPLLESPFGEASESAPAAAGAAAAASQVSTLQARIRQMQERRLGSKSIPTMPALARILPGGALQAGAAYSVLGSASLGMALLSGPSAAGAWCSVVGIPSFGIEAAARCGINLERLVLVPDPGNQWLTVTAALMDVMSLVLMRPPSKVSASDASRLGARLRQRGSTLIALGEWPQSEATLRIENSSWDGLGSGHGHLQARLVTVSAGARSRGGKPRTARFWFPDRDQADLDLGLRAPELSAAGLPGLSPAPQPPLLEPTSPLRELPFKAAVNS